MQSVVLVARTKLSLPRWFGSCSPSITSSRSLLVFLDLHIQDLKFRGLCGDSGGELDVGFG
jgi:hypothetical protein